jgi:hypothetical protein
MHHIPGVTNPSDSLTNQRAGSYTLVTVVGLWDIYAIDLLSVFPRLGRFSSSGLSLHGSIKGGS